MTDGRSSSARSTRLESAPWDAPPPPLPPPKNETSLATVVSRVYPTLLHVLVTHKPLLAPHPLSAPRPVPSADCRRRPASAPTAPTPIGSTSSVTAAAKPATGAPAPALPASAAGPASEAAAAAPAIQLRPQGRGSAPATLLLGGRDSAPCTVAPSWAAVAVAAVPGAGCR